uniref:BTB domain-containing protein n=1 Tax=Panagrolaimus davidi TaxID=227884 RepID=A0A914PQI6_9BILA
MIFAHKSILIENSSTLNSWILRWHEDETLPLNITNLSFEHTFELFKFLYSGDFKLAVNNYYPLIEAAHFFGVPGLEDYCTNGLLTNANVISTENVDECILFAQKHDFKDFENRIIQYVRYNFDKVVQSKNFKTGSKIFVKYVCAIDRPFDGCEKLEEQLFTSVYQWAEHRISLSDSIDSEGPNRNEKFIIDELSDILPHINFSKFSANFIKNFIVEKKRFLFPSKDLYKMIYHTRNGSQEEIFEALFTLAHQEVEHQRKFSSGRILSYDALMYTKMKQFMEKVRFNEMGLDFVLNFLSTKQYLLSQSKLAEIILSCRRLLTDSKNEEDCLKAIFDIVKTYAEQTYEYNHGVGDWESDIPKEIQKFMALLIPKIKFYKMSPSFLMEFAVKHNILSEDQVSRVHNISITISNGDRTLTGIVKDVFGIHEKIQSREKTINQHGGAKLRFRLLTFPFPKEPSEIQVVKKCRRILVFEKDGVVTMKRDFKLQNDDYILTELEEGVSPFYFARKCHTHISSVRVPF